MWEEKKTQTGSDSGAMQEEESKSEVGSSFHDNILARRTQHNGPRQSLILCSKWIEILEFHSTHQDVPRQSKMYTVQNLERRTLSSNFLERQSLISLVPSLALQ